MNSLRIQRLRTLLQRVGHKVEVGVAGSEAAVPRAAARGVLSHKYLVRRVRTAGETEQLALRWVSHAKPQHAWPMLTNTTGTRRRHEGNQHVSSSLHSSTVLSAPSVVPELQCFDDYGMF